MKLKLMNWVRAGIWVGMVAACLVFWAFLISKVF
jgi:hypothetical protein